MMETHCSHTHTLSLRLYFVLSVRTSCLQLRPLWKHYFNNTDALIYVVDSLDRERVARYEASHTETNASSLDGGGGDTQAGDLRECVREE